MFHYFTILSQTLCDTTSQKTFTYTEYPPKASISNSELEDNLNNTIILTSLNNYGADYLLVFFNVNCKGEDFNYILNKRSDGTTVIDTTSDFQKLLVSNLQTLVSWTPGYFEDYKNGKLILTPVDFSCNYIIRVDGNKLHVFSEKEKKRFGSKRKE